MTLTTLEPRQDHTPDLAADTIARMLDLGGHITTAAHVAEVVEQARLLACLVPACLGRVEATGDDLRLGRTLLQDIADRLWMVQL